jgi:hypothetical protein
MMPWQQNFYFDLTAKPYIFTPVSGRTSEAICNGLLVLDQIGSTNVIQTLYSTNWQRKSGADAHLSELRYYEEIFGNDREDGPTAPV